MSNLSKVIAQLSCVNVCCVCKVKIKLNDVWVNIMPEDYDELMKSRNLSHCYCHECMEKTMNGIKSELEHLKSPKDKW